MVEQHAKASFDSQKLQRLYASFNQFVAMHLQVAFDADPEQALATARDKRNQLLRSISEFEAQEQQLRSQLQASKQALAALDKLAPQMSLLDEESLEARYHELEEKLQQLSEAKAFIAAHGRTISELEKVAAVLDATQSSLMRWSSNTSKRTKHCSNSKRKFLHCRICLNAVTTLLIPTRWICSTKAVS